jgi:hypothetical protein
MKDYQGDYVGVGDRIELHPATDLWMRGAKYGNVVDLGKKGVAKIQLDTFKVGKFVKVSGHNFRVIEHVGTGRFKQLKENPAKLKHKARVSRSPKRGKVRLAGAGFTLLPGGSPNHQFYSYLRGQGLSAADARATANARYPIKRKKTHRRRRNKTPARAAWFVHAQKGGRGRVLTFNTRGTFSNLRGDTFHKFATEADARKKVARLLSQHRVLHDYAMYVSHAGKARRANPEALPQKLDAAAQKLEDFSGREARRVIHAKSRSADKTGLVVGEIDRIGYVTAREGIEGGRETAFDHKFRKGSRPLLAATTDGKQLHVVGGRYEFTEAGIEDR